VKSEPANRAIQVPPEKWVRGDYKQIAFLRCSADEIERRLGCSFMEDVEDGWEPFRAAGFETPGGRRFGLTQYLNSLKITNGPILEVTCLYDDRFSSDLDDVLESLDMDLSDVAVSDLGLAINPEVKLVQHALWRQDDNGVRILVEIFPCRANACKQMRKFEDAGHKQVFWVEPHGS